MNRILTSIPRSRFEKHNVIIPSFFDVTYIKPSEEEFLAHIKGTDYLWVSSMDTISTAVIDASDQLKMIHTQGVGFNKIDLEAASRKGIYVCNSKSANSSCVAEHTLALMLSFLRQIPFLNREYKQARALEARAQFNRSRIRQISDCHVGLIGFGDIGRAVASCLRPLGRGCLAAASYLLLCRTGSRSVQFDRVQFSSPFSILLFRTGPVQFDRVQLTWIRLSSVHLFPFHKVPEEWMRPVFFPGPLPAQAF